jgi:hypothetical protein
MNIHFGWKTRRKDATRKTNHRREDNIRIDLWEIGWEFVD